MADNERDWPRPQPPAPAQPPSVPSVEEIAEAAATGHMSYCASLDLSGGWCNCGRGKLIERIAAALRAERSRQSARIATLEGALRAARGPIAEDAKSFTTHRMILRLIDAALDSRSSEAGKA